MDQTCQDTYGETFASHSIVDGFTDEEIALLTRFNATSPQRTNRFDMPMIPTYEFHELWIQTLDAHDYVYYYHYFYGWALGIFWVAVVAAGITYRTIMHLGISSSSTNRSRVFIWVKRHVLTPATFGQRCVHDFAGWGTLPPRVQTLSVLLFVLLNLVCTVHGYRIFEGYIYYPSIGMQLLRHVSDRTGIVAFANFPLVWLFGMRNNLIIWLTGWEFKTYSNFHRWIARIATLQAVIHSIGYTILILRKGGWDYFWRMCQMTYWWTGELATIFMSALVGLSAFWFRRRQYEFFLMTHIVLSVFVLLTMLGHVSIFKGTYDALAWIPALIWLGDRVVRAIRIVAFNPKFWDTNALVSYSEDTQMIRMIVPTSSSFYRITPGTFYYVMVINKWKFWESHPFTVATPPSSIDHNAIETNEELPLLRQVTSSHFAMEVDDDCKKGQREMTFLIRPYDSFTSRLKEYAQSAWPEPAMLRVAIDGPYGETLPLKRFDKVLFVVGGSGIAVALSYLDLLMNSSDGPKSIHIHWAVRQPALALDILDNELGRFPNNDQLEINIYVTSGHGENIANTTAHTLVKWTFQRMNIERLLDDTLDAGRKGSLAVVASGPGRMTDECRKAVTVRMVSTMPQVEYFEESFQW